MALMSKKPGRPPSTPEQKLASKAARLEYLKKRRADGLTKTGFGFNGSTPDPGMGDNHNTNKNKPWLNALRMELIQADPQLLRKLARALINKAASGDVTALKEIADRMDGKTAQAIEAKIDAKVIISTDDSKL